MPMERLLNLMGGCSRVWGIHSFEGEIFADLATYGTMNVENTRDDFMNSRLIIMWGFNPAETVLGTNTSWYLVQAKERGARIVSVDPKYTVSAATFADQWIPIRPGTDAAMLIGMAYVIINERLQDQAFLDNYTVGFARFRDYVLGIDDGMAKTPGWAELITGVPAATIVNLARDYASIKPAALIGGMGPGRTAYGEQYHRAAMTLAAMTGNVGVHGGWSGGRATATMPPSSYKQAMWAPSGARNAVEEDTPPSKDIFPGREMWVWGLGKINRHRLTDAILKGKAGGYPVDYRLLFIINSNFLNQGLNTNRSIKAWRKLEFIAVAEQFMTTTAKFADVLLPVNTFMERNDICAGMSTPPFYGFMNKVIDPLYESKSHLEIAAELAQRLGISGYGDKEDEAWLREITKAADFAYDEFKKEGIQKVRLSEPYVAFKEEVEDPKGSSFWTTSGKIEIYSQRIADMNNPLLPPIPEYIETWESRDDPLSEKYPLQLITTHFKRRAHSQFENIPWLRELQTQAVLINSTDAEARGIEDGNIVRVFNDRGEIIIPATVTECIMPGVVDIPQGAWYDPDPSGADRGGCANVLTRDEPSPAGAMPTNTALVQIEKA
jgi:anaerobic dimethyl sulfoxide reductase subunit A